MNLKIINLMISGKFPFKRKLNEKEIDTLIKNGWNIPSENFVVLQRRYEIAEKRNICLLMNTNGTISITGLRNRNEGKRIYEISFKEIKKFTPKVLI